MPGYVRLLLNQLGVTDARTDSWQSGAPKLDAALEALHVGGYSAPVKTVTGTTYTMLPSDSLRILRFTNAGAIAVTLPRDLPEGFNCCVLQRGAGQITFAAASGGTLVSRSGYTKTFGLYAGVSLIVDANTDGQSAAYVLLGDGA